VRVTPENPDFLRVFLGKHLPESLAYNRCERGILSILEVFTFDDSRVPDRVSLNKGSCESEKSPSYISRKK